MAEYIDFVKIHPAPSVDGKTESERMDNAVRTMFTVPKEELQRREAEWKKSADGSKPQKS